MNGWDNRVFAMQMEYVPSERWNWYLTGAGWRFRRGIAKARPDARCAGLFDREIEAQAVLMKAHAQNQKHVHLALLRYQAEQQQGCKAELEQWLQDLRQELKTLELELEGLR